MSWEEVTVTKEPGKEYLHLWDIEATVIKRHYSMGCPSGLVGRANS